MGTETRNDSGTKLTPLGIILSVGVIAALLAGGWYVLMAPRKTVTVPVAAVSVASVPAVAAAAVPAATAVDANKTVEASDLSTVTTVKEYKYVPAEKLPPVKGVSGYEWDPNEKILKFSYNVWIGWMPVIAANHGTKPNTDSIFYKKYGFKVEMVLMDDPVSARDAYAAGKVHALWGTADMLAMFAPDLAKDSRTSPRIVQQIDFSSGGDGIVVRSAIKSVKDLRGKTIVCAQNSPSEYFITTLMISAGLRQSDVHMKYTSTAFEAAAAFVADPTIDAVVSWSPDIYKISDRVAGTRILTTTSEANKLIADVYAFRADFYRDHADVVKGFVKGVFEGMDYVKDNTEEVAQWMADAFGMKPEDIKGMMADAHSTNFAENVQFFLNKSNPTNFERTWKNASIVYRELGRIDAPVPFDSVMDFSIIKQLQDEGLFATQTDQSVATFTPQDYRRIKAESPILTQTIRINFFPNSADPYEPARDELGNVIPGKLFDPSVAATLERVGNLAGQFGRCAIVISGHTDNSRKGDIPYAAVKQLSQDRAQSVQNALTEKFKFDPNKFVVVGKAWDEPADPADPSNQALNRRVEISVIPPEK
ncbi:MAG: phosphate ABC transporter substrate-binding/OmpA family protein [Candidatus Omnitrophota bacterium]